MVRRAIAWGTYPVLLFGGTALMLWIFPRLPASRSWESGVVSVELVVVALVILALQRLQPAVEAWTHWTGAEFTTDTLHGFLSNISGAVLARMVFFAAIAAMPPTVHGLGWWPDAWPLWAQLGLGVVAIDLAVYWIHRSAHHFPWLWRLHAVHHSSERLYGLSSGRAHPLYVAGATALTSGALLAAGVDPPILALISSFTSVNGLIQHSNLRLAPGPLRWILADCEMHRWHHATDGEHQGSNFGNTFVWWDALFGTLRRTPGVPERIGLGEAYPEGWLAQVAAPFRG